MAAFAWCPCLHLCVFLLFATLALQVSAITVNVTVDDYYGDERTGVVPSYLPNGIPQGDGWVANCTSCFVRPNPAQMYDQTWHHATDGHEGFSGLTMEFSFVGTAAYIYCALPAYNGTSMGASTLSGFFFTVDGAAAENFAWTPPGNVVNNQSFIYNYSVFSVDGLNLTNHTVTMELTNGGVVLFDYAVYTTDDSVFHNTTSSSSSKGTSATSGSTATSSAVSKQTQSLSKKPRALGALIGGAVAAAVVALGLVGAVILLCCRRRKRKVAGHMSGPVEVDAPVFKTHMDEVTDNSMITPFVAAYPPDIFGPQTVSSARKSQDYSAFVDSRSNGIPRHVSPRATVISMVPSSLVLPPPSESSSTFGSPNGRDDGAAAADGSDVHRVMSALRAEVNRLRREQERQVFDDGFTFVAPPDYNETVAQGGVAASADPSARIGSRPLPVPGDRSSGPSHPQPDLNEKERRFTNNDSQHWDLAHYLGYTWHMCITIVALFAPFVRHNAYGDYSGRWETAHKEVTSPAAHGSTRLCWIRRYLSNMKIYHDGCAMHR